jgi:hypothetical protein
MYFGRRLPRPALHPTHRRQGLRLGPLDHTFRRKFGVEIIALTLAASVGRTARPMKNREIQRVLRTRIGDIGLRAEAIRDTLAIPFGKG